VKTHVADTCLKETLLRVLPNVFKCSKKHETRIQVIFFISLKEERWPIYRVSVKFSKNHFLNYFISLFMMTFYSGYVQIHLLATPSSFVSFDAQWAAVGIVA